MNNTKFKQTEIGLIPENWILQPIADNCLKIISGGTPSRINLTYWTEGDIDWLKTKELTDGPIYSTEEKITEMGFKNSSAKFFPINTILMAMYGATVGKLGVLKIESTTNQAVCGMVCDPNKLDYRFLFYSLLHYRKSFINLASGAAQQNLNQDIIGNFLIPCPSLSEQKAIAKILSDLDSKIELNQQMNKTLEEIGKTLFKRWFIDFEFPNEQGKPYKSSGGEMVYNEKLKKEIPKGWNVKPLKELVLLNKRGIPPKYVSDGVPVLNQRCIRDKIIFNDPSIQYHDSKKSINSELYLKSFDILINSMGVGTLGRISQASVVDNQYLVHSCITIIRADPQKISPFLLGYYFKDIQPMIEDLGEGSTGQTSLDNKKLDNLLVVVPDKEIQDKLDILFNSIILETGKLDSENIKLAETRDSLLPKLMSGKIRVKY